MRTIARATALAALAVPFALGVTGTANAESAPGCSGTTQIGSTAYLNVGGQTMASVKQFVGCGKNWAYMYVWQGYRNTHGSWSGCASVAVNGTDLVDSRCADNAVEIWSGGANTVSQCTEAVGWNGTYGLPVPGDVVAHTDMRC
jgi:hypothetical protein